MIGGLTTFILSDSLIVNLHHLNKDVVFLDCLVVVEDAEDGHQLGTDEVEDEVRHGIAQRRMTAQGNVLGGDEGTGDGGRAVAHHVSPTRVGVVGGEFQREVATSVIRECAHQLLDAHHATGDVPAKIVLCLVFQIRPLSNQRHINGSEME